MIGKIFVELAGMDSPIPIGYYAPLRAATESERTYRILDACLL